MILQQHGHEAKRFHLQERLPLVTPQRHREGISGIHPAHLTIVLLRPSSAFSIPQTRKMETPYFL